MSAIPACATISWTPAQRSTRAWRSAAIGGSPRPPWMRIGTFRSAASSKTGGSRASFSAIFCARGCSLIPFAPRSRQRIASSIGILVEVEAHERDEAAVGLLGEGERAVVRRAEGGMPVGLVEAEHERAADAVLVHHREQLFGKAAHAVDVATEVDVRVEDLDVCGKLAQDARRARRRAARAPARARSPSLQLRQASLGRADVDRARPDQPPGRHLLDDVRRPAARCGRRRRAPA